MPKLIWDEVGKRFYETGVTKCVLYPQTAPGVFDKGVAWNGVTGVTENPSGADLTDLWADDIKYASLRSAETFGATIEAYMYPDEFAECDGSAEPIPGVLLGQQSRKAFCFAYRTSIGNDASNDADAGYKLHLIYNATASPSDRSYATINDSPDAITFSWELTTNPVIVAGYKKPVANVTIDSMKVNAAKLEALEEMLYGTETEEARMPMPAEVLALLTE